MVGGKEGRTGIYRQPAGCRFLLDHEHKSQLHWHLGRERLDGVAWSNKTLGSCQIKTAILALIGIGN